MQGLLHEHAIEQRQRQREAKGVDSYPRGEADRGAGSPLDAAAVVVVGGAPEPRVSPEPGAGPEPGVAVGGVVGDVLGGAGSPDDAVRVKAPALRGAGAASVVREGG